MQTSPKTVSPHATGQSGFALIIALSLMAFVLLLLLSITTLVQVETQGSQIQQQRMEAEQTALLSLNLAIGELQKAAGPDQRVTADASIRSANAGQPHLLGVWKSFKQQNDSNTSINYTTQKNGDFVQWLNSTATIADKTNQAYPQFAPTDPVTLVGSGTLPIPDLNDPATQYVQASTKEVLSASGNETGRYAWHIFDESQKANLTLNDPEPDTNAKRVAALGVGGMPSFETLAPTNALYPLTKLTAEDKQKITSVADSSMIGDLTFDPVEANAFHLLTTNSKNLLVDVVNGGYQKDLSLLFADATLPIEYEDRYIYSDSDTPVVDAPTRFGGGVNSAFAQPIPSPDPKWALLHSHYKLYRSVSAGSEYSVTASDNARFIKGSSYDTVNNPVKEPNPDFFDQQQILPVISNAQFIYSITPQRTVDEGTEKIFVQFIVDTVVTLWNPYNVDLKFSDMEIEFYRFPFQLEFFRNDALMTTEPAHTANMFSVLGAGVTWEDRNYIPFRARIQGDTQGSTITLKPGEYKVFSPTELVNLHQQGHYFEGMVLREGWDPFAGGAASRRILRDSNGNNIGRDPDDSSTSYVVAEADDEYSVRVSASKINSAGFLGTNGQEIAAYLKVFMGDGGDFSKNTPLDTVRNALDQSRIEIGAIELDLTDAEMASKLPNYDPGQMSRLIIPTITTDIDSQIKKGKVPLVIASLRLKTEQDSDGIDGQPNASMWLHNGIANPYFTAGIDDDQNEKEKTHQYELTWEPMGSWNQVPSVEIDNDNRGYGGSGVTSASDVNYAPFMQIPLVPASSLAQFSHAPLNAGGQAPLTTQVVGNSFSSPLLSLEDKSTPGTLGTHLDHSYMANNTLFDGYFLSTAVSETDNPLITSGARDLDTVVNEFIAKETPLTNVNLEPVAETALSITPANYDTFAQHLYNKGAFNVNSTSVEAWALFLASGTKESLPILDMLTASTTLTSSAASTDVPVSRFAPLIGDEIDATVDAQERWEGHRKLDSSQILTLAEFVVDEVRKRGPFQSVAEFVNRQLSSDFTTGGTGTLQAAIDSAAINTDHGLAAPKNKNELDTGTGTGNTSDGAATQITQADLLNRLAPSLTVRGDTFRIRAYGETTSLTGDQTVKAWCEAVVQRQHDFVDDTQPPTTVDSSLSSTNETFGRRFKIVSFRWLSADEV